MDDTPAAAHSFLFFVLDAGSVCFSVTQARVCTMLQVLVRGREIRLIMQHLARLFTQVCPIAVPGLEVQGSGGQR